MGALVYISCLLFRSQSALSFHSRRPRHFGSDAGERKMQYAASRLKKSQCGQCERCVPSVHFVLHHAHFFLLTYDRQPLYLPILNMVRRYSNS